MDTLDRREASSTRRKPSRRASCMNPPDRRISTPGLPLPSRGSRSRSTTSTTRRHRSKASWYTSGARALTAASGSRRPLLEKRRLT